MMQLIIGIAFLFAATTYTEQSYEQSGTTEDTGYTIQTALKAGWKLAKSAKNADAVATITKGMDAFSTLFDSYKTLINKQPALEEEINGTIDSLKQRLTDTQAQLRIAQTKEPDLAKAQADLNTLTAERNDLKNKVSALEEENKRLKDQITVMHNADSMSPFAESNMSQLQGLPGEE